MKTNDVMVYEPMAGEYIKDVINKMIGLSKENGKPVQATFNDATFAVTADTNPEEAYKLWKKTVDENYEKWRNSPEGIKDAEEQKARDEKKARENAEVDELIKDEKLELTAENAWKLSLKNNQDPYGSAVMHYAERWAKLMQVEMRTRGLNELTGAVVKATKYKADNEGMSGFSWGCARNLLIECWKYGAKLGELEGFEVDEIREARLEAEAETATMPEA